ncbi:Bug family tripartite tricarboxylate transporter substrate binding protein [Thauera sinica]|uniref:Bug family tripartite tricarboxylate transporter substrate binding protein n=1 Tax=Thauera sinica TaxID=2665146 RepID=A0ABW1AX56_9RHOO|nr:Bug family tripartite tricarboxylate transporter substrate binding protein [Thauera sp. K11]ATE61178.1 ABC transporter substrate-binding protein [Thauera sp. K11]
MLSTRTLGRLFGLLMMGAAGAAHAADGDPVRLIVGFPPGGSTDTVARVIGDELREQLKRPVIVENKPGAGGRIAAQALKGAPADGTAYMLAPNATAIFQNLLYSTAERKYDLLTDFTPVGVVVSYPLALAVSKRVKAGNLKEYVQWVKAHPEDGVFGTAGAGGHTHFSGLQLGKAIGVDLQVVPYKGNGPLVTDLLGSQIAAGVMTAGDILQHHKAGTVKVLAVFGASRSPLMPDVPTVKEQGYDVDTGDAWTAVWAPAKTPKAEIERMQQALKVALDKPAIRENLTSKATLQPDFRPAAEMDKLVQKELAYWGPVIKASGFTPAQ